jgi:uncharacterized membrane protein|nr:MAG TPA: hypothetical protein [Caudoviricetes sp.]
MVMIEEIMRYYLAMYVELIHMYPIIQRVVTILVAFLLMYIFCWYMVLVSRIFRKWVVNDTDPESWNSASKNITSIFIYLFAMIVYVDVVADIYKYVRRLIP